MKFVVAPDSFKGSLSATEAAIALETGIRRACHDASVIKLPVADGGEGTLEALISATGGKRIATVVQGPFGEPTHAAFGLLPGGETAVIEMALAAGLHLTSKLNRNPLKTSTYGVGELILAAVKSGARRLIVGIGGSCTNDGGAGALSALGVKFLDTKGRMLGPAVSGGDLDRISHVDLSNFLFPSEKIDIVIASDVTNPLTGPDGASMVYGPQKGATVQMTQFLDSAMKNYGSIVERAVKDVPMDTPGAGAAGGLGFALMAFLNGHIISGVDLVLNTIGFDNAAKFADYVFTGEGRIDRQTLSGKVVTGVLHRCLALDVPLIAFAGSIDPVAGQKLIKLGLYRAVSIVDDNVPVEDSIRNASTFLESAAEHATISLLRGKTLSS
jgi:glycerate kinase